MITTQRQIPAIIFSSVILLLIYSAFNNCFAQNADSLYNKSNGLLRVYLDCSSCNPIVIKSEIPFINYVRDPAQSDVHVIITRRNTASGGLLFNFRFIGMEKFNKQNQELTYTSLQSDTDIKRQEGISRTLALGLMRYISQTSSSEKISFKYENGNELPVSINQDISDPWDSWVFGTDLRGGFDSEENSNSLNLEGSVDADRVTEEWRFRNSFDYQFREENFDDEGEKIRSTRRSWDLNLNIVKSLSNHWSLGVFGSSRASTYQNIRLNPSFYSGIEYNFFQWSDFSRRILTLGYYIGYKKFHYYDETIYGKTGEGLIFHSLRLEADVKQPWGNFYGFLDFSHYPELSGKYRIRLNANLSFRITEGLSFTFRVQAQSIHDQLYLPKGDASLEEILLKQRQLQTTYRYESSIGLRYTFGSIYNNVVNIRM